MKRSITDRSRSINRKNGAPLHAVLIGLAGNVRRGVLAELACGPKDVRALRRAARTDYPAMSKELRRLRDLGLVSMTTDWRRRVYQLTSAVQASVRSTTATLSVTARDGSRVTIVVAIPSRGR